MISPMKLIFGINDMTNRRESIVEALIKRSMAIVVLLCAGALSCAAQGAIPDLNSRRLLNDLQVTVARTQQFGDSVAIGVVIRYGAAFDPDGKGGLSNIVTQMLMKSVIDRSEQDIRTELESLGASIEIRSDWDGIRILLRSHTAVLERSLMLLQQIVSEARFEEDSFLVVKQSVLDDLQKPTDPRRLIHNQFDSVLFQETTYARPLEGTLKSVTAITLGDVRYFYRRFFSPNQASLKIVGNIDPATVHQRVARIWGIWVRNDEIPFTFAQPRNLSGREIHVENDRDSPSAQFILGGMFPRHEDPDYINTLLAARILEDRINRLLPTSLMTVASEGRRLASPFYIQGQAAADEAFFQIRDVLEEIDKMRRSAVTDEELAAARQRMTEEFNQELETVGGLCNVLLDAELYRLGSNYVGFFIDRVRRSDAEAVQKAANTWFFPDGEIILIRGPLPLLKTRLDTLGTIQLLTTY